MIDIDIDTIFIIIVASIGIIIFTAYLTMNFVKQNNTTTPTPEIMTTTPNVTTVVTSTTPNVTPTINQKSLYVVCTNNDFYTSPDGISWTKKTIQIEPLSQDRHYFVYDVSTNSEITVFLASNGNSKPTIMYTYSDELLNGTYNYVNQGGDIMSFPTRICYGNEKFVAVGSTYVGSTFKKNTIGYSFDGLYWFGLGTQFGDGMDICYGNNMFVGVFRGANTIAYSYDGIIWNGLGATIISSPVDNSYNISICFGNGYFVAVAQNKIAYSANGINWTTMVSDLNFNCICYGDNKFVAFSNTLTTDYISSKGIYINDTDLNTIYNITFTASTQDERDNDTYITKINYGNGKFIAGLFYGKIYSSSDLLNWSPNSGVIDTVNSVRMLTYNI